MSRNLCCNMYKMMVDPSCIASMIQTDGGCVMMWGIVPWYTLGLLVPIEHQSPKPTWVLLLNPIEHLWDAVEQIHMLAVQLTNLQQLGEVIMSKSTKSSEECFQHPVESMSWIIQAVLKVKRSPTF